MTRKEAITELRKCKQLILHDGKDWFNERDLEVLDMAIEALQTAEINCVHCERYSETEDNTGVHGRCSEKPNSSDRDCEHCAHHTAEGCSSWECEYQPADNADQHVQHVGYVDLISRQDAIEAIAEIGFVDEDDGRCHDWEENIEYAEQVLEDVPSAEKTETVRCKDCNHYQNDRICRYFSRFGTIEMKPYDYCSRANKDYGVGVQV